MRNADVKEIMKGKKKNEKNIGPRAASERNDTNFRTINKFLMFKLSWPEKRTLSYQ